jgi:hypothetical protein
MKRQNSHAEKLAASVSQDHKLSCCSLAELEKLHEQPGKDKQPLDFLNQDLNI